MRNMLNISDVEEYIDNNSDNPVSLYHGLVENTDEFLLEHAALYSNTPIETKKMIYDTISSPSVRGYIIKESEDIEWSKKKIESGIGSFMVLYDLLINSLSKKYEHLVPLTPILVDRVAREDALSVYDIYRRFGLPTDALKVLLPYLNDSHKAYLLVDVDTPYEHMSVILPSIEDRSILLKIYKSVKDDRMRNKIERIIKTDYVQDI